MSAGSRWRYRRQRSAQATGHASWRVRDKLFVWERPLRSSDRARFGEAAPDGPILGVRVEHLIAKEALIADEPRCSSPHRISMAIRRS